LFSISLIFTASFETLAPDYPSSYVLILPRRFYLSIAFASAIDEAPPRSFTLYLPPDAKLIGLSIP
jgi:hypothetical protein